MPGRPGRRASFTGSGGAIVGTYPDEATFQKLQAALAPIRCRVIRPLVIESNEFEIPNPKQISMIERAHTKRPIERFIH